RGVTGGGPEDSARSRTRHRRPHPQRRAGLIVGLLQPALVLAQDAVDAGLGHGVGEDVLGRQAPARDPTGQWPSTTSEWTSIRPLMVAVPSGQSSSTSKETVTSMESPGARVTLSPDG